MEFPLKMVVGLWQGAHSLIYFWPWVLRRRIISRAHAKVWGDLEVTEMKGD